MKKNIIIVLLVLILPVLAYMFLSAGSGSDMGSVDAKTTKPQIIKFTSAMCLDCQTMNKIMKEIYPQYQDRIALTEIHVQDNKPETQDWIKKYNVTLVPTIILMNSQGQQVRRIEGAVDRNVFEGYLKELK